MKLGFPVYEAFGDAAAGDVGLFAAGDVGLFATGYRGRMFPTLRLLFVGSRSTFIVDS